MGTAHQVAVAPGPGFARPLAPGGATLPGTMDDAVSWQVAVIGSGINGAGVALLAAPGYRVTLIDGGSATLPTAPAEPTRHPTAPS